VTLTTQHVRLGNIDDTDGVLVYRKDVLVAVMSQLSAEHGERAGRWYLEIGFGACPDAGSDFQTLEAAKVWIESRLYDHDRRVAEAIARRGPG
jgi:hypothetical protein